MDIQLCDKHLIYSVLISRYWTVISEYSAPLSEILKQVNMNNSDIAAEHLGISIEYMRCLSHSWISRYWSWIWIILRVHCVKTLCVRVREYNTIAFYIFSDCRANSILRFIYNLQLKKQTFCYYNLYFHIFERRRGLEIFLTVTRMRITTKKPEIYYR